MYAVDELRLLSGANIPIINLQQTLRQPTLNDIALFDQKKFFYCVSMFNSSDGKKMSEQIEKEKGMKMELSDYESFKQMFFSDKNNIPLFNSFFMLLFPNLKNIVWNQYQTTIEFEKDKKILDDVIFDELKYVILKITGMDKITEKKLFNPANDRASEIAEKIERHRRIVAKEKANLEGGKKEEDFLTNMISCMSAISGISINEIMSYTYYQLVKQYQRTLLLDSYHVQMSMSIMGGLKQEDIIDWQKNI